MRFLWILAIEPRFLTTVDAQTLEQVSVDYQIRFKVGNKFLIIIKLLTDKLLYDEKFEI